MIPSLSLYTLGCLSDNLFGAPFCINSGMYNSFSFFVLYLAFLSYHCICSFNLHCRLIASMEPVYQWKNPGGFPISFFPLVRHKRESYPVYPSFLPLSAWSKVTFIEGRMFATMWWHGCIVSSLQRPHCHASFHRLFTSMRPIPLYTDTLLFYALNWHHMRKLSWPLSLHVRTSALWPNIPRL